MKHVGAWLSMLLGALVLGAGEAKAVTIAPGDILVADLDAFGGSGGIIKVNPVTRAQTAVASGGFFVTPTAVAIAPSGDLFVVDADAFGGNGGVIRVDPRTGAQTPVSSGGYFVRPAGIVLAPNGDLLVVDADAFGGSCPAGCGGVIRVDPLTGAQSIVSSGGYFVDPYGILLTPKGDLFVVDANAFVGPSDPPFAGPGGVIRVDLLTGGQTPVTSGGEFIGPYQAVLAPNGDLLVPDPHTFGGQGSVVEVNPVTGAQTEFLQGGLAQVPLGIAWAGNGDLLIVAVGAAAVVRVDPVTKAQSIVTSFGLFGNPNSITVAPPLIVTGAGPGRSPLVRLFEPITGAERLHFFAYDPGFLGGVRVAVGDINGDGVPDIITGAGPGGGPHVKVFDGAALLSGQVVELFSFLAYDPSFTGGVFVAAGDLNGDGRADIITGAGPGGGPHVKGFDGQTGGLIRSFFAYDPAFGGGVAVAAGDVNGDGVPDIITGAGPGGGPHVKAFDGVTGALIYSFFAYDPGFLGGVAVAAGDVNGDGRADIITGAGPGGGPHVREFDGTTGLPLSGPNKSFFAYAPSFTGGVFVAVGDVNDDGVPDIITGAGPGGGPHVREFDGTTGLPLSGPSGSFLAYDPSFSGGVFVAVFR